MAVRIPEEAGLASRITAHLKARPSNERVALLWQGYLAALFEWGSIDFKMYERLASLVPDVGGTEIAELFLEPDWEETSKLDDNEFYKKINS